MIWDIILIVLIWLSAGFWLAIRRLGQKHRKETLLDKIIIAPALIVIVGLALLINKFGR